MDEDTKWMVNELNKVLKTNYNIISFNELNSNDLIKVFCDIINLVPIENKLKFQSQNLSKTIEKMMEILNNIGYKIPEEMDTYTQRELLMQGEKRIIHPIILWILKNFEKVSIRAYLSEYLVRIPIPVTNLQNPEVNAAYKQYITLINNFKDVHSEHQRTVENNAIIKATKEKIESLNKNIEFISSRLTATREKLSKYANLPEVSTAVEALWNEYLKEEQMLNQMKEQQQVLEQIDLDLNQCQKELTTIQHNRMNSGDLIKRIENEYEELSNNLSQLPNEIAESEKQIEILRQVTNIQGVTEDHLNEWRERIQELNIEIAELEEKKRIHLGPMANKLAPFKKELTALNENQNRAKENLAKLKREHEKLEKIMKEKQVDVDKIIGHEVKRGSELKDYIRKLREKNSLVDVYREIISCMKTEHEIQTRTMEILSQKQSDLQNIFEQYKNNEPTKIADPSIENINTNSISDLVKMCQQKRLEVDDSKAQLSAFTQEVLPLRKTVTERKEILMQKQKELDVKVGGLKKQYNQTKRELENMQKELTNKEDEWKALQTEIENKEETLNSVTAANNIENSVNIPQKTILTTKLKNLEENMGNLIHEREKLEQYKKEREAICKSWLSAKKILEIKIRNREALAKKMKKIGRVEVLTL